MDLWKNRATYKVGVYVLPKKLDEEVARLHGRIVAELVGAAETTDPVELGGDVFDERFDLVLQELDAARLRQLADKVLDGTATGEDLQALKDLVRPEEIAARRGLPLEDVAPAAMLRARAGQGV